MAKTTLLGDEFLPAITGLSEMIERHAPGDPVRQQKLIELLMMRHAVRMGNVVDAVFVLAAMHKHASQMARQYYVEGV